MHVALPGPPGAEDSERLSGVCAREGVRAWCENDVIGRRVLARERPRQVSGLTGGGLEAPDRWTAGRRSLGLIAFAASRCLWISNTAESGQSSSPGLRGGESPVALAGSCGARGMVLALKEI